MYLGQRARVIGIIAIVLIITRIKQKNYDVTSMRKRDMSVVTRFHDLAKQIKALPTSRPLPWHCVMMHLAIDDLLDLPCPVDEGRLEALDQILLLRRQLRLLQILRWNVQRRRAPLIPCCLSQRRHETMHLTRELLPICNTAVG